MMQIYASIKNMQSAKTSMPNQTYHPFKHVFFAKIIFFLQLILILVVIKGLGSLTDYIRVR